MMFFTLQSIYHFFYKVIDIKKFKLYTGIINLYGKVVGDVVAECGNRTVIIGTTPFAKEIRETIYQYSGTCFSTIFKEQFLTRQLALTVIAGTITANQGCLDAT